MIARPAFSVLQCASALSRGMSPHGWVSTAPFGVLFERIAMRILSLQLANYRNYVRAELRPCAGVTVLAGDNAQGKTNLLEAVYLCCTGRSHRTRQDRELIRWGADFCRVAVEAERRDGTHAVEIAIPAAGRRKIRVNGSEISRSGELMGHVTGVLFSPEDLRLVKDGPAERRRFIDIALSQVRPSYYYALQRYARALKQRNELLRAGNLETLESWDEQLARAGAEIMAARAEYIARLSAAAARTHADIACERETLSIAYAPNVEDGDILRALRKARDVDMRRMTTSAGVHRDDVRFCVDGRELRLFGSQGQQRTAALSVRLAELDVVKEESGEAPVLLLDDVMSELDPERRRRLLAHLDGVQTIVTCTDIADIAGARAGLVLRVEAATLTQA